MTVKLGGVALSLGVLVLASACNHYHPANEGLASAAPNGEAAPPVAGDGAFGGTAPTADVAVTEGSGASLIDVSSTHGDKAKMLAQRAAAANAAAAAAAPPANGGAPVASAAQPQAPQASAEDLKASQTAVLERDAAAMKELGGAYLCDQRVMPSGGGAHISAWEWAFPVPPAGLAEKLGARLKGSTRTDSTIRIGENVVIEVEEFSGKSRLGCLGIPVTTKSLVVVSTR
jgi:hypothetical protein